MPDLWHYLVLDGFCNSTEFAAFWSIFCVIQIVYFEELLKMTEAARQMNSIIVYMNLDCVALHCQGFLYIPQPQEAPIWEMFLKRHFKGKHFEQSGGTERAHDRTTPICFATQGSHERMGTHCISGSPYHRFSMYVDVGICLDHHDLVTPQRKERSRIWPSPSPKPRRLKKRQCHCWSLCELLCGALALWKLPPTMISIGWSHLQVRTNNPCPGRGFSSLPYKALTQQQFREWCPSKES